MQIKDIYNYYNEVIKSNKERIKKFDRGIYILGTIRLIIVLGAFISIILWSESNWKIYGLISLIYAIPFLIFMLWHERLSTRRDYAADLITLCQNELAALNYDFSAFDGASSKISTEHPYCLDLDLFGAQSLFQSVNRTVTSEGKNRLCEWFLNPSSSKASIINKQNAIRELSLLTDLRQHFFITGSYSKKEIDQTALLEHLVRIEPVLTKHRIWQFLVSIIPASWVLLILLYWIFPISPMIAYTFFIISSIIAFSKTKYINKLHSHVDKMDKILSVYSRLISIIENNTFESEFLITNKKRLETKGIKASKAIGKLSGLVDMLDQRGNIFALLFNAVSLRDLRTALNIERWKENYKDQIGSWFDALGDFDALLSLAGFSFNHPNYIYPDISTKYFEVRGTDLGHPLLNRDKCVCNDIAIKEAPHFMIVTGANMAGKSTYLRTIGVNYLLACIGAPVYAKELVIYPTNLITSLRTTDSLTANESYFYAELKRLKNIIDKLQSGEKLFIILDEILKGTNSIDKQKGSLALIRQLIRYNTCGIIATHDLILGSLYDELPDYISNYRFEADIDGNELSFTYKLQEGIAKNLNACFLMEKMGITV